MPPLPFPVPAPSTVFGIDFCSMPSSHLKTWRLSGPQQTAQRGASTRSQGESVKIHPETPAPNALRGNALPCQLMADGEGLLPCSGLGISHPVSGLGISHPVCSRQSSQEDSSCRRLTWQAAWRGGQGTSFWSQVGQSLNPYPESS